MKFLKWTAAAVALAVLCIIGLQAPVSAGGVPIRIAATNGQGVNVRTGPSLAYPRVGKIPEGVNPRYICYTYGQRIGGGPGVGTTLWFRASYKNVTGYYSSAYDTVPYSWQSNIEGHYGIFRCSGALPAVGRYNRQAAVNWALAHARDPQPMWLEWACAWFASNALWAGGLPKTSGWTNTGIKNPPRTATYAPSLFKYLQNDAKVAEVFSLKKHLGYKQGSVPAARLGDLIFYDWDGNGSIDHASVVVHISPDKYPDVAEWGLGPGQRTPYKWRGWSWSVLDDHWFREGARTKNVNAWLVHIK